MKRKALAIAASLLVVGAYLYHGYWPRERTGRPPAEGPLAAVLARADLPVRLWIAYPHQNLGLLAASGSWTAAVDLAGDLGLPRLELPSFGPLAAPPARALAVATDAAGERAVLAAEVYRLPALAARLAGRLAGNPWLAGGSIETDGRVVEVAWYGRTWVVERGRRSVPGGDRLVTTRLPTGNQLVTTEAIASAALSAPAGPLPAGLYRLARRDRALELTSGAAGALETLLPPPAEGPALLAAVVGGAERFDALAILPAASSQLPDAVVFHRGSGKRWSLPGEPLYEMLGRGAEPARRGPWELATSSTESLQEAEQLLPYLNQLFARATRDGLRLGLWVDLPAARQTLGPLAQQLARLPISEARALATAAAALEGLAGWQSLSLAIVERPQPGVLARLAP